MSMFKVVFTMLCALLGVAFLTLVERKVLSYMQVRKGPNKVGVVGILQPISDALKLFFKESVVPHHSNKLLFMLFPMIGLGIGLYMWGLLPSYSSVSQPLMSVILFLCISAVNVYIVIGAGWSSNSVYAFLGGLRASAQTISYEISLVFVLLLPCMLMSTMDLNSLLVSYPLCSLLIFSMLLWFISCLAETNRAPFDFAEGESELVSGFNIEYGGGLFALLFLGEYTMILFMSMLTGACFFGPNNVIIFLVSGFVVAMMFLIVRGVFPRYRYDKLMSMCWKSVLPLSMSFLCILYVVQWL